MNSDAIQDEGDMALKALLSTPPSTELAPELRERAKRLAARHFGAGGELPTGLLPEGAIVGTYRVERILGMGGQAVVYLGRHVRLQSRLVAIKVPHGTETYRMMREADVMARLDHPGVVKIVDLNAETDPPYLVLDYCVGGSLAERTEAEGPLSEPEVLQITRDLLEALRFAHLREIVHRDLKPENVLFDASGMPRIADFGLGKIVAEQLSLSLSHASRTGVAGTPLYMAPEQERPGAPVDGRADLFALGKLIYHMLTGEPPRTLRPVEHSRSDLTLPWSDLVFALTETFPDSRPADADAALAIIDSWPGCGLAADSSPLDTAGAPSRLESAPVSSVAAPAAQVRAAAPAQDEELAPLADGDWQGRFQRLFDKISSDLGYSVAFLLAAGGSIALIAGNEAGVVAVFFSAVIAFFSGAEQGHTARTAIKLGAKDAQTRGLAGLSLEERALERDRARTRVKSAGATFAAFLAILTGMLSFFTAMGGTIALVLREQEGGVVALVVSGFFFLATLILLVVRRQLEKRAAARSGERWGPIDHAPAATAASESKEG